MSQVVRAISFSFRCLEEEVGGREEGGRAGGGREAEGSSGVQTRGLMREACKTAGGVPDLVQDWEDPGRA